MKDGGVDDTSLLSDEDVDEGWTEEALAEAPKAPAAPAPHPSPSRPPAAARLPATSSRPPPARPAVPDGVTLSAPSTPRSRPRAPDRMASPLPPPFRATAAKPNAEAVSLRLPPSDQELAALVVPPPRRSARRQAIVGIGMLSCGLAAAAAFLIYARQPLKVPAASAVALGQQQAVPSIEPSQAAAAQVDTLDPSKFISPTAMASALSTPEGKSGRGLAADSEPARQGAAAPASGPQSEERAASARAGEEAVSSTLASATRSCTRGVNRAGVARASVTFAPDGRASQVWVSGSAYQGSGEGQCVSDKIGALRVPPFSGRPILVRRSFEIR